MAYINGKEIMFYANIRANGISINRGCEKPFNNGGGGGAGGTGGGGGYTIVLGQDGVARLIGTGGEYHMITYSLYNYKGNTIQSRTLISKECNFINDIGVGTYYVVCALKDEAMNILATYTSAEVTFSEDTGGGTGGGGSTNEPYAVTLGKDKIARLTGNGERYENIVWSLYFNGEKIATECEMGTSYDFSIHIVDDGTYYVVCELEGLAEEHIGTYTSNEVTFSTDTGGDDTGDDGTGGEDTALWRLTSFADTVYGVIYIENGYLCATGDPHNLTDGEGYTKHINDNTIKLADLDTTKTYTIYNDLNGDYAAKLVWGTSGDDTGDEDTREWKFIVDEYNPCDHLHIEDGTLYCNGEFKHYVCEDDFGNKIGYADNERSFDLSVLDTTKTYTIYDNDVALARGTLVFEKVTP